MPKCGDYCTVVVGEASIQLARESFRKNVVQAKSFAAMLEQAIRKYQNRAIEAAQVIEEMIEIAKDMRRASERGAKLQLSDKELAFYDALGTNDSVVQVLGDETSRTIAREVTATVRKNVPLIGPCVRTSGLSCA